MDIQRKKRRETMKKNIITTIIIFAITALAPILANVANAAPVRVIPFEYEGPTAPVVPFEEVGPTKADVERAKKERAGATVWAPTPKPAPEPELTKTQALVKKAKLMGRSFAETGSSYGETFRVFGKSLYKNFLGE
jgi:hypothetical protein